MIKFNHAADLHFKPSRADEVFASLDALEKASENIDLNILAGDLWDYPVQNTAAAQFPAYIGRIARLAARAPIVMVQGTPTHDSDGSLDVFEQVSEKITVLEMGLPYFLIDGEIIHKPTDYGTETAKALILGLPEPQKKHLIAAGSNVTLDQAVRDVLIGYGAIRAKYPDLPCILVYHGQVNGARMANGEPVEGGVSIDDLALVGADYIAMGDIHKPQRVGASRGLNAYYAGAAYPVKDWNESDIEFGFNRVTIRENVAERNPGGLFGNAKDVKSVEVERLPFPHPMLTKLETKGAISINADKIKTGTRVWWEVTASKEESALIDSDAMTRALITFGALSDSRVTIKLTATETVRAGEITAMRKLRDKFALWCRNSGRETSEKEIEKCDVIEELASGRGISINGGDFSFDKLVLRGAKGIWKKQRKDEISLDLTAFDPGIVGLVGPNGRGKTTIFDSFHMWTEFPNRPGPAYRNFRLKDSVWEVYATEHKTGTQYRKRILIDPTLKQPKAEYFLDRRQAGGEWESVPGITGRLDDYEKIVASIFGSFELYVRTAYQMQKRTPKLPDLSEATKSTKKAIMSELSGLDFYATYKEIAEGKRKTIEADVKDRETRLSVLAENLGDRATLEGEISKAEIEASRLAALLPGKEEEGKKLASSVDDLKKLAADQIAIADQVRQIDARLEKLKNAQTDIVDQIGRARGVLETRDEAADAIAKWDDLKAKETSLNAEKTTLLESINTANEVYRKAKEEYDVAVRAIEADRRTAESEHALYRGRHENTIAMNNRDIETLLKAMNAPIADTCPTCGQSLPEDAIEHVKAERAALQAKIDERKADNDQCAVKIAGLDEVHAATNKTYADKLACLVAPEVPEVNQAELSRITEALKTVSDSLDWIDIDAARKTVELAVSAAAKIEELEKQLENNETRKKEDETLVASLRARLDDDIIDRLSHAETALAAARREYGEASNALERARVNLERARKSIDDYQAREEVISGIKNEIATLAAELAEWRIIEKATGPDGIPALELDATCPTIAAVTSELLSPYEEGRYSVRFDTTREGGKGNQIEDFLIMVIDAKDGEEQEFETLSGGEAVWVRKALQDAFGIIRGQNSNVRYLTGFLDESDSALFPEARIAYFRMLEVAHKQSVRRHTVMVTHSAEIQEMIQQKIEVTAL